MNWYRFILPKLAAKITGKPRRAVEISWSKNLLTYNLFRVWELLFWRRDGIRPDGASMNGMTYSYSWEHFTVHIEVLIREFFKRNFAFKIVYVPQLQLAGLSQGGISPFRFAIAFDNRTGNTGTGASLNHLITGSQTFLNVKINSSTTVTAVTYNSVTMTNAVTSTNIADGNVQVSQWYLKGASTGTNPVAVTGPANSTIGAFSYTGALQTGGVDAGAAYYNSVAESGNITVTISVSAANSWLVASQDSQAVNPDAAVNGSFQFTTGTLGFQDVYSNADVGAGSQTIGFHWPSLDRHAISAFGFAPDAAGPTTTATPVPNLLLMQVG